MIGSKPEQKLAEKLIDVCAEAEESGMGAGTAMLALAMTLGTIGGGAIVCGSKRSDMHELFEKLLTVMVTQADMVVSFAPGRTAKP
jgi:hypothetical protein